MRCAVQVGTAAVTFCICKKSVVHAVNCLHVSFKVFSAMIIDILGFMYRINDWIGSGRYRSYGEEGIHLTWQSYSPQHFFHILYTFNTFSPAPFSKF
jgi:hypothetical protein